MTNFGQITLAIQIEIKAADIEEKIQEIDLLTYTLTRESIAAQNDAFLQSKGGAPLHPFQNVQTPNLHRNTELLETMLKIGADFNEEQNGFYSGTTIIAWMKNTRPFIRP